MPAPDFKYLKHIIEKPEFRLIGEEAGTMGVEVYLVGGYVRDVLIGRRSKDADLVVVGDGIAFAKHMARVMGFADKITVFKNFQTAHLKTKEMELEFVGARKESYSRHTRNPQVQQGTLEDDLSRRDFTINTLAISVNKNDYGNLVDLFKGWDDLKKGIIKTPLAPGTTFSDDPLRMMRAIRFAAQLQFRIQPQTLNAIAEHRERISIITQERITDELNKIMASSHPSVGFKLLMKTGLLHLIFPELVALHGVETINGHSHKDNFFHTLQVLDNLAGMSDNLWLRWAALLHDIGKPSSKRFEEEGGWTFHGHEVIGERMIPKLFRKLKLPLNDKMKYVQKIVALHLRPIALAQEEVSDSALRRLLVEAGDDIEDLFLLCRADITSKNEEKVERYLARFDKVWERLEVVEKKDQMRNWKPPITGEIVMETFGIKPGPEVGKIKHQVREAILSGDIPNKYDAAFEYMLKAGKDMGLKKVKS
ncbi:MAG: HD domain-containing protein [Bacteroidia bacterium]